MENVNGEIAKAVVGKNAAGLPGKYVAALVERYPFPYKPLAYIEDSTEALYIADMFIGRSGASAVGEAIKFGLPSVFIPYAHHKDKQQILNAIPLADAGLACIHPEAVFGCTKFLEDVYEMLRASRQRYFTRAFFNQEGR